MYTKNSIRAETLTSIDSDALTGEYQAINPDGLSRACSILRINNDAGVSVEISYDGTTSSDYVGAGDILEINVGQIFPNNHGGQFVKGLVVYVMGTAGQAGAIYLTGYSQQE